MSANKTRVLIVVSNLEYGGAQRQIVELVNNIDSTRYLVHIASLSDYKPLAAQLRPEIPVHIVLKKSRFDFSVVFKLVRLIRSHQFQILHSYLFDAEIAARLAGFLSSARVIGGERNTDYHIKSVQLLAYRLTRRLFDVIIANSHSGAEFNSDVLGIPARKYRVIYNGVDDSRFRPRDAMEVRNSLGIAQGSPVLGVFASFKEQKNHRFLFEALLKIRPDYPNLRVLLVGDMLYGGLHGSDRYHAEILAMIENSSLKDICLLLGNRDDVESLYPACDFTVLPSLFEGTPNVILESMSCGVPIIATRVSDNDKIVIDGETGLLVDLDDVDGLVCALRTLLDNPEKRSDMGERARRRVLDHFSSKKLAENTSRVYDELVADSA